MVESKFGVRLWKVQTRESAGSLPVWKICLIFWKLRLSLTTQRLELCPIEVKWTIGNSSEPQVCAGSYTVWEEQPAPADECPRVFSILVTGLDVPVVGMRIHLDQSQGGNWNKIDAIELIGMVS